MGFPPRLTSGPITGLAGIIADKGYVGAEEQFLQKPFTADALEAKVREILAQAGRA